MRLVRGRRGAVSRGRRGGAAQLGLVLLRRAAAAAAAVVAGRVGSAAHDKRC